MCNKNLESEVRPINCFNILSLCLFCAIERPFFFIPMKKISIDFPSHQLVPLPLYCSLLRKNAHHVSCRVFWGCVFFEKAKQYLKHKIKFFHIFSDGKISGKTQSWPQVWKTQKVRGE